MITLIEDTISVSLSNWLHSPNDYNISYHIKRYPLNLKCLSTKLLHKEDIKII